MPGTRLKYDDDLLVEMIARRGSTYEQIGRRLGLSWRAVGAIARGQNRAELQARIQAVRQNLRPDQRRPRRRYLRVDAPPGPRTPAAALRHRHAAETDAPGFRRHVEYDDDLLVELIGGGETPFEQIARRVGISRGMVARIARGELRADLLPRINAALRESLRRARATIRRQAAGHPAVLSCKRKKHYDDELLVALIVRGDVSFGRIARIIGLTRNTVSAIANGRARPDLQPRIQAGLGAQKQLLERLGARYLRPLLAKHIKIGMEGDDALARRCREFVLELMARVHIGPPQRPPRPPGRPPPRRRRRPIR